MDINIEAVQHNNQASLKTYYEDKLLRKYNAYPFVKAIDVKIDSQDKLARVSLLVQLEKGPKVFASHLDENENRSFTKAIKKVDVQIEKYKQKHYA